MAPVLWHVCRISVTFLDRDGTEYKVKAAVGENMLSVAHREEIDLEGACEGSLACSTCHVIIKDEDTFSKLPEASDDENDMLDLAFGLTETCGTKLSRVAVYTTDLWQIFSDCDTLNQLYMAAGQDWVAR